MFTVTPRTITVRNASLTYAAIPWDCQYLDNTTIQIKKFTFTTKQEAKHLLFTITKQLKLAKGDLLFLKTSPLDIKHLHILTSLGFYVIEEAVEISFDLSDWNPNAFSQHAMRGYRLVSATKSHLPSIKKIAGSAFTHDRYHLDPNIPARGANKRFIGWVETSMKSTDEVFAFVDANSVVIGFFIIAKNPDGTNLRLAAIDPSLVGKGLGKLLYYSMFSILKKRGDTSIQTQISLNNTAVLNVYTYLVHPKVTRVEMVLHFIV
ncbi:MAG: GNAT family N-acetyltransferase [Candidatus Gottesmanbacteria bacterium]|nr:GNAT family N-acetyltransferase [Candidatus Gottesmanbacteria bacterium]